MSPISSASRYRHTDELWLLTPFFNPAGFESRLRNYRRFRSVIEASGLRLVTIECAFADAPFQLSPDAHTIQVRARDVLWQKERLLNVVLARLPGECRKVAWVDGDVLFENADWAAETARLLEDYTVLQPFETAVWLSPEREETLGDEYTSHSFAAAYAKDPASARLGRWEVHGETGFAWAARREVLEEGLYDGCVIGGADHVMAHAFAHGPEAPCVSRIMHNEPHREHFERWGRVCGQRTDGRIGVVPGTLLHLWHGEREKRRYLERYRELATFDFDPCADLRVGPEGCWEWASDKLELHHFARSYFARRIEDGAEPVRL